MTETYFVINLFAGLNSFGLFSLLFFRKNNSITNISLSFLMLITSLYLLNSALMLTKKNTGSLSYLFFFVQFLAIFFTPSVYVFINTILGKRIKKNNYVFVISFLIGLIPIVYCINHTGLSHDQQKIFFTHLLKGPYPTKATLYSVIFYSFQQIIFFKLLYECYVFKRKSKKLFSSIGITKVRYTINLLWILTLSNLFIISLYLIFDILFVEYLLLPVCVTTIYTFIIYHTFKNSAILTEKELSIYSLQNQKVEEIDNNPKTMLSNQELAEIETIITNHLNIKKAFKDSNISLIELSKALNIPSYIISMVLNHKMNTTFYDLINNKRIETSLQLLKTNKNFTIESIALDVGFKSKSSFYRAFKKYKRCTPTEYLKKH